MGYLVRAPRHGHQNPKWMYEFPISKDHETHQPVWGELVNLIYPLLIIYRIMLLIYKLLEETSLQLCRKTGLLFFVISEQGTFFLQFYHESKIAGIVCVRAQWWCELKLKQSTFCESWLSFSQSPPAHHSCSFRHFERMHTRDLILPPCFRLQTSCTLLYWWWKWFFL